MSRRTGVHPRVSLPRAPIVIARRSSDPMRRGAGRSLDDFAARAVAVAAVPALDDGCYDGIVLRIENETEFARMVFPGRSGPGREGLHLDFKRELPDDGREIALDIAAFANMEGGVLAYGVDEDEGPDGRNIATSIVGIGDVDDAAARVEQAMSQWLHGLDFRPRPEKLMPLPANHVLVVNVPASPRLVGARAVSEKRGGIVYPYRTTHGKDYLRPEDVERRIMGTSARAMRIRLADLLAEADGDGGRPVKLHFLKNMNPGTFLPQPRPWPHDVSLVGLTAWGISLHFQGAAKRLVFEVPYEWIASVWWWPAAKNGTPTEQPALLVAADLSWEVADDTKVGIRAVPMPWSR